MTDASRLELDLAALGPMVAFPPTPRLSLAVAVALRSREADAHRRPPFWRPLRRGLGLGLLAAVLVAGLAAALGLTIGGLRIQFGPPPSVAAPPSLSVVMINQRAFGTPTTLDAAPDALTFDPLLPTLSELGDPDYVFVSDPPVGGALSLVWRDRTGYPATAPGGIGLVVTEFRADLSDELADKWIDSRVVLQTVAVGDGVGVWLSGGSHYFFYRDAEGQLVERTLRIVGNTLLWEQDGLTLRVEGAGSLEAALRVATSLRPLAD